MKEPIEYQVIKGTDGAPEYAVVLYDDFMALMGDKARIPHAVARRTIIDGVGLVRAWREHKGLTQKNLADRAGITQAALSQMEKPGAKPHRATIRKLANALGVGEEQLVD
ncbi:MAG: helix-turn-helix transcriptional regulator [Nitrospinae bacterium]|nr:helix-turn-helix transcriptional regulator [Nitrospinota bacterium]